MKTHYREVHKSDHLSSADLEEMTEKAMPLIFTIKEVRKEIDAKVAGKKINANIAYFTDSKIKPLVLNVTNSKVLRSFAKNSPFIQDWAGLTIELYVDPNVKMKGDIVGGVRIKPQKPTIKSYEDQKTKLANSKNLEDLKDVYLSLDKDAQRELVGFKDELKNKLS
jgi:hypothetical protein